MSERTCGPKDPGGVGGSWGGDEPVLVPMDPRRVIGGSPAHPAYRTELESLAREVFVSMAGNSWAWVELEDGVAMSGLAFDAAENFLRERDRRRGEGK